MLMRHAHVDMLFEAPSFLRQYRALHTEDEAVRRKLPSKLPNCNAMLGFSPLVPVVCPARAEGQRKLVLGQLSIT